MTDDTAVIKYETDGYFEDIQVQNKVELDDEDPLGTSIVISDVSVHLVGIEIASVINTLLFHRATTSSTSSKWKRLRIT